MFTFVNKLILLSEIMSFENYSALKEKKLSGRYITPDMIQPLEEQFNLFSIETIGESVKGNKIKSYRIGEGKTRLLFWSQMHGNESTSTKALFDFFHFIQSDSEEVKDFLERFTFLFIPILNPDGAIAYTRINANNVDLNRDAQNLNQPESRVLRAVFDNFKPNYCFNLHDQRTIFSAGEGSNSSILSFLTPSQNVEKDITDSRKVSMSIIADINTMLQTKIPNCVGRYDDGFNINCVGDTFQSMNVPTVLFEAGHYPNDYSREKTRELFFYSLLEAVRSVYKREGDASDYEAYFDIPENKKLFCDIMFKRVKLHNEEVKDLIIQFEERLDGRTIQFVPKLIDLESTKAIFGHLELNCENKQFIEELSTPLELQNVLRYLYFDNKNVMKELKSVLNI